MFDGIDEKDMNQRFSKLLAELDSDPARKADFQKDPQPHLTAAGIPLLQTFPAPAAGGTPAPAPKPHRLKGTGGGGVGLPAAAAAPAPGKIDASAHWWGVDIVMDEQFTQDVINGVTDSGAIASALTPLLAPMAGVAAAAAGPVAGGLALCVVAKVVEIRLMDLSHTGVHWPITWPQWALLLASLGAGPVGLAAAAGAFVHPFPN
jgi:hypothetical protein